ncbi:hypothetical protein HPOKI828_06275 [Helicobacter pylori oki828]|nr:hypothetical protein HPOKI828_06275 [Helicobacter pylori oki828]
MCSLTNVWLLAFYETPFLRDFFKAFLFKTLFF